MKCRAIPLVVPVVALSLWSTVSARTDAQSETPRRANIIFLLTDDMRWDAMGCVGNTIIQTPHLDRLASQGTLFTNTFCTTSICAVSRASFLTGQYESRHRISGFRTPLSTEAFAKTFPALLRRNGYRTGFIGKWGLGGPLPKDQFDFWAGFPRQGRYFEEGDPKHLTAKLGKKALRFLLSGDPNKPFLLCVSFKAPHVQDGDPKPFQPDPRFDELYREVTIPTPKTASNEAFEKLPPFLRQSEGRVRWERRFATPQMCQDSVKNYYRLITGVDEVVGDILDTLEQMILRERTVIIFTSDNGFFLGEHGLAGKWFMHEESIRLPLIICDPSLPESRHGKKVAKTALSIDIAPTILDLVGVPIPVVMQGRSLKPLLQGQTPPWRQEWFYEHHYDRHPLLPQSEGVRTKRWKYVRYLETQPLCEQLFDLQNDPAEQCDLAPNPSHAETLSTMQARWQTLRDKVK